MTIDEWKKKQLKKPAPQYTHFDCRVSLQTAFGYITCPEKIIRHGFYPFIHYTDKSRKVKDGKRAEAKKRQIYYASHIDGWIYKYYSYLINELYNQRVKDDGISDVAVAYRTDLGKSNIQFADEAFSHIRGTSSCYVLIGDFTDFFDNLNHNYLKRQLCDLLSVKRLPDDFYAVYKNVTHFSFIELQDLLVLNGLEDTKRGRKEFNSRDRDRALSPEEFRKNKVLIKHNPSKEIGVPQGSPISAVLANVYMLSADKLIYDYVSSNSGFYMRYSDDFIVVFPQGEVDFYAHYKKLKEILDAIPNLTLKDSKTKIFHFENGAVVNCSSQFLPGHTEEKNLIEFLGFSFDGKEIRIRDRTISRYYNRMYRKVKTIIKGGGYTPQGKKISAKNLYSRYSYRGSVTYLKKHVYRKDGSLCCSLAQGNFFDYVARAKSTFKDEPVEEGTKRHMQKIRKQLNKIP